MISSIFYLRLIILSNINPLFADRLMVSVLGEGKLEPICECKQMIIIKKRNSY